MDPMTIAMIVALVLSVVIHEMAHAYAATWLGDPTARLQGRLSANPLVHLDPFMSVILPGLLVLTGSPILFGAAKPVPYNPYNFTNQRWGEALVAVAGPIANLAIAVVFALIIRVFEPAGVLTQTFLTLSFNVITLNIFLALFNLVPIPPLDGSKILPKLLPLSLQMKYDAFRRVLEANATLGFLLVIFIFVFLLSQPLSLLTYHTAKILVGG